jgi:predicted nucleic acid-binding protein
VIVVSDASPILNLAVVGHLELLRKVFGQIVLPPSVAMELGKYQIEIQPGWMSIVAAQDREQFEDLRQRLDLGEAEAIIVAKASLILIDEHRARRIAAERGIRFMGLLGVLAEAKDRHIIHKCKPILDGMIREAGFWIGNELRTTFLTGLGEQP